MKENLGDFGELTEKSDNGDRGETDAMESNFMEYCVDLGVTGRESSKLKSENVDFGDNAPVLFFCFECDFELEFR